MLPTLEEIIVVLLWTYAEDHIKTEQQVKDFFKIATLNFLHYKQRLV